MTEPMTLAGKRLPDYPVVVVHMEDPPGSGLAACCGLPWTKPNERKGDVLWACTGCFRWPSDATTTRRAVAAALARVRERVKEWLTNPAWPEFGPGIGGGPFDPGRMAARAAAEQMVAIIDEEAGR